MALSLTYGERQNPGSQFMIPATVTFDSSYLTGGETLTAATFGLDRFENIVVTDSEGYTYDTDIATGGATALLKAYYADYSTSTDGALIEVANTVDLSAVSVNIMVYGR